MIRKGSACAYRFDRSDLRSRGGEFPALVRRLGDKPPYRFAKRRSRVGRVVPNAPQEEFAPQFDLDGNQTLVKTSTGVRSVTYNGENRPVLWSCGATNITMKYDRMGRRVEYVETVNGSTNMHHRFMYDGYLCVQRLNGASNNAVELAFGWDPTESVATRPLWIQRVSGTYNFFYFHE